MKVNEKLLAIQKVLQEEGKLRTTELSKLLGISEVTIRRCLAQLEKEGLIKRIWGGVAARNENSATGLIAKLVRAQENRDRKARIGSRAAGLVE